MIATPICCTSDYYSSSDIEYDDDDFVVKAAPQHHSSTEEINIILQTLLQHHNHQTSSHISSTIRLQQSMRLLKLVKENHLSDEIFIRANSILYKFLLSTCTNDIDDSILIACLSLATKLSEHSNLNLFNTDTLILNENVICNALDWDIDMTTPLNYVEAILLQVIDYSIKDRLRKLSYELIVLCLTDVRCMDLSVLSMGMGCLLMACELLNYCEIIPKQVLFEIERNNVLIKTSSIYIRQILMNILRE